MEIVKLDVLDGKGLIHVAVTDLFDSSRLIAHFKDSKEALYALKEAHEQLRGKK